MTHHNTTHLVPYRFTNRVRATDAISYMLCNSLGAEVLSGSVRAGSTEVVDANGLAPGWYTLRTVSSNGGRVHPIALMKAR